MNLGEYINNIETNNKIQFSSPVELRWYQKLKIEIMWRFRIFMPRSRNYHTDIYDVMKIMMREVNKGGK